MIMQIEEPVYSKLQKCDHIFKVPFPYNMANLVATLCDKGYTLSTHTHIMY